MSATTDRGAIALKTSTPKLLALAMMQVAFFDSEIAFAQQSNKPNVVFILADNVGYGDLGPYGGGELRCDAAPR